MAGGEPDPHDIASSVEFLERAGARRSDDDRFLSALPPDLYHAVRKMLLVHGVRTGWDCLVPVSVPGCHRGVSPLDVGRRQLLGRGCHGLHDLAVHTTIICGFYPRDGRSLLDDWGPSDEARAAERSDIEQAGMIWAPPPTDGIESDPSLDAETAAWLGDRLQPHPGRTIFDAATVTRPITEQSVTVIADTGENDPRNSLPSNLADNDLANWGFQSVPEGHSPMLGYPELLVEHLSRIATTASQRQRR